MTTSTRFRGTFACAALAALALATGQRSASSAPGATSAPSGPGAPGAPGTTIARGAAVASAAARESHESIGAACESCHPSIVASYRETGMARALDALRPGELEGLAPVEEPETGFRYHFEQTDGRALIVETYAREGEDAPVRSSAPLAFAVGAGLFDRSYVIERFDRLWFAPLEVVSAARDDAGASAPRGKRHAALAPPHAMDPGKRFDFAITRDCLACHTDRPPAPSWPRNLAPSADEWTPRGIDCGACHANAEAHVAWREGRSELDADPFVSRGDRDGPDGRDGPRAPERPARMSVCASCHLQGDARIELESRPVDPANPVNSAGATRDLLDERVVFVAAHPTEEIGFVSQTERLVASRCYTETSGWEGGGLTCVTCHDPHVSIAAPGERERVRAACLGCHADASASAPPVTDDAADDVEEAQHAFARAAPCDEAARARARADLADASADCVTCHMPLRPVFDVASVAIHDHFVRSRPGAPVVADALRFYEAPNGDWRVFAWPDGPSRSTALADDPGLRMMALYNAGMLEEAAALVDAAPHRDVRALATYHHARGVVLETLRRFDDAERAYAKALELDPASVESQNNLGLLHARAGRFADALRLFDDLVWRYPKADGALRNRAAVHEARGNRRQFVLDLERAVRLRPTATLARALAVAHYEAGDDATARKWEAAARRLDPREHAHDDHAHGDRTE